MDMTPERLIALEYRCGRLKQMRVQGTMFSVAEAVIEQERICDAAPELIRRARRELVYTAFAQQVLKGFEGVAADDLPRYLRFCYTQLESDLETLEKR